MRTTFKIKQQDLVLTLGFCLLTFTLVMTLIVPSVSDIDPYYSLPEALYLSQLSNMP